MVERPLHVGTKVRLFTNIHNRLRKAPIVTKSLLLVNNKQLR